MAVNSVKMAADWQSNWQSNDSQMAVLGQSKSPPYGSQMTRQLAVKLGRSNGKHVLPHRRSRSTCPLARILVTIKATWGPQNDSATRPPDLDITMQLTAPHAALLLIIVLPIIWITGFPRHAFRRRRDISSLLLRTIIIVLLVLALAGLQNVQAVDRLAVVFLVDASDSMGSGAEDQQLAFIREAIKAKAPDDEWAVVLFGENALPETDFSLVGEIEGFSAIPGTTATDIANGIQTALSMFPPDAARRIVILSDGQATAGDALARAQRAAVSGVEISYLPFARGTTPDVRITTMDTPGRVAEEQSFDITVGIHAESATPATLLIFSRGRLIHEEALDLQAGDTRYSLTQTSDKSGFLDFTAQIVVPGENDKFNQNNQLGAFSQVIGPARVLLVRAEESETLSLLPALEGAGILVDVAKPADLPVNMAGLANFKSVILANVPAADLSRAQMVLLDQYVSDIGGGLVMIGGPESYAPRRLTIRPRSNGPCRSICRSKIRNGCRN